VSCIMIHIISPKHIIFYPISSSRVIILHMISQNIVVSWHYASYHIVRTSFCRVFLLYPISYWQTVQYILSYTVVSCYHVSYCTCIIKPNNILSYIVMFCRVIIFHIVSSRMHRLSHFAVLRIKFNSCIVILIGNRCVRLE
jgi:hypothetical protein